MAIPKPAHRQRPSIDQIDQIKELSTLFYDDPGQLFRELGYPTDRYAASEWIAALQKARDGRPPAPGGEADFVDQLPTKTTTTEDPSAMPESKTCSKCKESKPLDQYHKNSRTADGLRSDCKTCVKEYNRQRIAGEIPAKIPDRPLTHHRQPAKDDIPRGDSTSETRNAIRDTTPADPDQAKQAESVPKFDPTLSQLRAFAEALDRLVFVDSTLEAAAELFEVAAGILSAPADRRTT